MCVSLPSSVMTAEFSAVVRFNKPPTRPVPTLKELRKRTILLVNGYRRRDTHTRGTKLILVGPFGDRSRVPTELLKREGEEITIAEVCRCCGIKPASFMGRQKQWPRERWFERSNRKHILLSPASDDGIGQLPSSCPPQQ